MAKFVIIDGNAILHRAFHALPPLTTKKGEPINAVYGLVSMLLRFISDLKPTHLAVCFDRPEPTFRHKAFKEYQSQRPQTIAELSSQFAKARRVLAAFNIPVFEKAGYEADDLLGTIASQSMSTSKSKADEVVIVTGDRDILQLVTDRIRVYMPVAGLANGKLMDEAAVIVKMGVKPEKIDDYKALVGDPSDNYPGVPGIGPKTAISLLEKYGSLAEIYKNLKEIPTGTAEKLKKGRELAKISKKLATIIKDVPLSFKIEECAKWDMDSPEVLEVFADFGFKTLTERVKKVGKELDQEKQESLF